MKYQLTLSESQAALLMQALELFARLGIGQFEEIASLYSYDMRSKPVGSIPGPEPIDYNRLHELCKELKKECGLPENGHHGIHNTAVPDRFRVAWEIYHVIRHRMAWDRNPEGGWTNQFDQPTQISQEPLPKIEKVQET